MISLRDLLWQYLYGGEAPGALSGKEIAVSLLIAVLLLALYRVFQKIIFYGVNESARHSQTGAQILAAALALGWLLASLDLLGLWTSLLVLLMLVLLLAVDLTFLLVTRGK